jgi:CO/xanthine dehydrogenase Mo-binding subunit
MSVVGASIPRSDGMAKAAGEVVFSIDYEEAGTLVGKILRAPVAAGRIVRLDVSRARAMPGVRAVVTAGDVPPVLAGWIIRDTPMFASTVVRYIGEPIAAVAADTLDQALRARDAIELEIEPIKAVGTIAAAIAPGAPLLHPDLRSYALAIGEEASYPRYGNIAAESATLGDPAAVEAAFATAAHVITDELTTQRQYQGYLETKNALGIYRGGRYIVHGGSQWPYNVRTRIGQFFDVPPSRVRVIGHPYGGGFGGKLDFAVEPHAVALSRAAGGRPVKIVNTRTEDIITASSREGIVTRIRSAVAADGTILARDMECYMDNGAYTGEMAFLACFPFHFAAMSYRVGALRAVGRLVYTNAPPTAAMRGVTAVPLYVALELHMDHIARELGIDRKEYRMRHLFRSGDVMANGQTLHEADILRQHFDAVEKIAPWTETSRDHAANNKAANATRSNKVASRTAPLRGAAIAPAVWLTNPLPGSATVKLQEDGSVVVITGANDPGTGSMTTGVAQIVADELGLSPDRVLVTDPDTDFGGFDGGAQGSRNTPVAGRAALDAAREVRQKVLEAAGQLLQAPPADLELVDGHARVKSNPGRRTSLADIGAATTFGAGTIQGTGRAVLPPVPHNPSCASGLLFAYFASPTYHVHFAEVEVDPVTGNVKVLRYVVAQEVGKAINPMSLKGQIQGGVTQGIGFALYESLRIEESGKTVENTFKAYRLPLAIDVPRVEAIISEHPSTDGPFGAKGAAEPPILLPAALIACAVSNAIGKPIRKIPITPEDVLAALHGP